MPCSDHSARRGRHIALRSSESYGCRLDAGNFRPLMLHCPSKVNLGEPALSDVTQILSEIEQGDPHAADQLLPLVYEELRRLAAHRLAQEKAGQTLQATALVHEAYLRLVDVDKAQHWDSRRHFFAAAAEAMRRILVENARRKQRLMRGGNRDRQDLDDAMLAVEIPPGELLEINDAIEALQHKDGQAARLVKLHYFTGMSIEQAAELLGISRRTAFRDWAYAKAWLYRQVRGEELPADR